MINDQCGIIINKSPKATPCWDLVIGKLGFTAK